ncbi:MAG: PilZ domain-containing protein [Pseudomonas sp.]|uniref:PilZ domain-containing protein n=1 Tax=Pseudomonas sp. TaxID=306 RepID=UPI002732F0F0|nr:PilZ domain-containing protein [Pseudomonas sp.]MDP3847660.1 PilZ domain-containing protein [Pseudomonas sp.]
MTNQRDTSRAPLKVRIRIDHPVHGELQVMTRDISDSGVFVVIDDAQRRLLTIGEVVSGQVQGLPMEAPILQMQVVRFEPGGVALRFKRD